jgi:hypothetical protein
MKETATEPPDAIHLSRAHCLRETAFAGKVFAYPRSNSLKLPKRLKRLN